MKTPIEKCMDNILSSEDLHKIEQLVCKLVKHGVKLPQSDAILRQMQEVSGNEDCLKTLDKFEWDTLQTICFGLTQLFILATLKERM